jgi:sugar O-acyltransferase (sialic acid O-acetyltransferase NeuD family)
MQKVVFIGSGGVAREVTAWAREQIDIAGYVTLDAEEHARFDLPGKAFPDRLSPVEAGTNLAVMAVGVPKLKRRLYDRLSEVGFTFVSLVAPNTWVAPGVELNEGAIVCPLVNISCNVRLGKCSYVNFGTGIGHDAIVGNFAQLNPGVQVGGYARIGEDVLVGSGATVREGVSVGDGATVASGAVVMGRVGAGATMMGNPARRFRAFEP